MRIRPLAGLCAVALPVTAAQAGQTKGLASVKTNVAKRRKELDVAGDKAKVRLAKLDKSKSDWERLAKNLDLREAEEGR